MVLSKPIFTFGVFFIIYPIMLGKGRLAFEFLAAKPMAALGKLTYSIYMVHVIFVTTEAYAMKTYLYFSNLHAFLMVFHYFIYSFIVAIALSIMVESPMLKLEKMLMGDNKQCR